MSLGLKYGMTSVAAVASVLVAAPAAAQMRSFNVPAQPAEKAIPIFARQAGVQILASGKVVKGKQTRAVQGEHQVDEALAILLQGTGLKAQRGGNGGIITIVSASAPGNGSGGASGAAQAGQGQGQAALVGSVRDHKTGAALKGARVEVVETGEVTSTGDLGDFRFARLPAGDVTLRISYLGFLPAFDGYDLRGVERGTYAVSVQTAVSRRPDVTYVAIQFDCDAANVERLVAAASDELKHLREEGTHSEEIRRARAMVGHPPPPTLRELAERWVSRRSLAAEPSPGASDVNNWFKHYLEAAFVHIFVRWPGGAASAVEARSQ